MKAFLRQEVTVFDIHADVKAESQVLNVLLY